jgi:hypothetical protein
MIFQVHGRAKESGRGKVQDAADIYLEVLAEHSRVPPIDAERGSRGDVRENPHAIDVVGKLVHAKIRAESPANPRRH